MFAIDFERDKTRKEADAVLSEYIADKGVRQFLLKNLKANAAASGLEWKINLGAIHQNYKNILQGMQERNLFEGKVLFIAGALSDYIKPDYRNRTTRLFPNAEMKIIPEATHWLHAEKPRIFVSICMRFLEQ